jgi:hypothetical protein
MQDRLGQRKVQKVGVNRRDLELLGGHNHAIEDVSATYGGDRRWRIEHAQILDPKDISRFARLGVIASMQPVHQTSDRTMAEARLDSMRRSLNCSRE